MSGKKSRMCAEKKSGVFCTLRGLVCMCLISNGSGASSANHRRRHCDASELMREKQKIGWGKAKTSENFTQSVCGTRREKKRTKRKLENDKDKQRRTENGRKRQKNNSVNAFYVTMWSGSTLAWKYNSIYSYSGKRYMNYRCRWKTD